MLAAVEAPSQAVVEAAVLGGKMSPRWRNNQPRPAGEETQPAERRDRAEPVPRLRDQRHDVQAPAKKKNAGEKQPPRAAIGRAVKRETNQRDRVHEVIEHGLVPDLDQTMTFDCRS